MSSLPKFPLVDRHKSHLIRKSSKPATFNRTSKMSNYFPGHAAAVVDGRSKRVQKACERCRVKKIKCDGESPCKRCKDDGHVCFMGSKKKAEFKQLPRGYAEFLEITQYILLATTKKLYNMVRNSESWDLGEPGLNERGQPIIHDIASRLECMPPSLDLSVDFSKDEDFAEWQAPFQASRAEKGEEDTGNMKFLEFLPLLPSFHFPGSLHALDLTAQSMRPVPHILGPTVDGSLDQPVRLVDPNVLKAMQMQEGLNFAFGPITQHLLDSNGCDSTSQMDTILFGNEYESQIWRA